MLLREFCRDLGSNANDVPKKYQEKVADLLTKWQSVPPFLSIATDEAKATLLSFLHRTTLQLVLDEEWPRLHPVHRTHLRVTLQLCESLLSGEAAKTLQNLLVVVDKPWGHDRLQQILSTPERLKDNEVSLYCNLEKSYLICMRLVILCEARCYETALKLAAAYVHCLYLEKSSLRKESSADEINLVLDIYIALLHKFKKSGEIYEQLKLLGLRDGLNFVRRCSIRTQDDHRIFKHSSQVAEIASHYFLTLAMVKPVSETGALLRELILEWTVIHRHLSTSFYNITNMIRRLIQPAESALHIYIFCEVLTEEFDYHLKTFCIELYVRALTTDMNELEKQKLRNDKQRVRDVEIRLSEGFLRLASLVNDNIAVSRECVLTAFSLNPTQWCYESISQLALASGKRLNNDANKKYNDEIICESSLMDEVAQGSISGVQEPFNNTTASSFINNFAYSIINADEHDPVSVPQNQSANYQLNMFNVCESSVNSDLNAEPQNNIGSELYCDNALNNSYGELYQELNENALSVNGLINTESAALNCDVMSAPWQVLDPQKLGLTSQLCDDLAVILSSQRYQTLRWDLDWPKLDELCRMYLKDAETFRNTTKELKFLNIDYNQFKNHPTNPDEKNEFCGIEKGYEQWAETGIDETSEYYPRSYRNRRKHMFNNPVSQSFSMKPQTDCSGIHSFDTSDSDSYHSDYRRLNTDKKLVTSFSDTDILGTEAVKTDILQNSLKSKSALDRERINSLKSFRRHMLKKNSNISPYHTVNQNTLKEDFHNYTKNVTSMITEVDQTSDANVSDSSSNASTNFHVKESTNDKSGVRELRMFRIQQCKRFQSSSDVISNNSILGQNLSFNSVCKSVDPKLRDFAISTSSTLKRQPSGTEKLSSDISYSAVNSPLVKHRKKIDPDYIYAGINKIMYDNSLKNKVNAGTVKDYFKTSNFSNSHKSIIENEILVKSVPGLSTFDMIIPPPSEPAVHVVQVIRNTSSNTSVETSTTHVTCTSSVSIPNSCTVNTTCSHESPSQNVLFLANSFNTHSHTSLQNEHTHGSPHSAEKSAAALSDIKESPNNLVPLHINQDTSAATISDMLKMSTSVENSRILHSALISDMNRRVLAHTATQNFHRTSLVSPVRNSGSDFSPEQTNMSASISQLEKKPTDIKNVFPVFLKSVPKVSQSDNLSQCPSEPIHSTKLKIIDRTSQKVSDRNNCKTPTLPTDAHKYNLLRVVNSTLPPGLPEKQKIYKLRDITEGIIDLPGTQLPKHYLKMGENILNASSERKDFRKDNITKACYSSPLPEVWKPAEMPINCETTDCITTVNDLNYRGTKVSTMSSETESVQTADSTNVSGNMLPLVKGIDLNLLTSLVSSNAKCYNSLRSGVSDKQIMQWIKKDGYKIHIKPIIYSSGAKSTYIDSSSNIQQSPANVSSEKDSCIMYSTHETQNKQANAQVSKLPSSQNASLPKFQHVFGKTVHNNVNSSSKDNVLSVDSCAHDTTEVNEAKSFIKIPSVTKETILQQIEYTTPNILLSKAVQTGDNIITKSSVQTTTEESDSSNSEIVSVDVQKTNKIGMCIKKEERKMSSPIKEKQAGITCGLPPAVSGNSMPQIGMITSICGSKPHHQRSLPTRTSLPIILIPDTLQQQMSPVNPTACTISPEAQILMKDILSRRSTLFTTPNQSATLTLNKTSSLDIKQFDCKTNSNEEISNENPTTALTGNSSSFVPGLFVPKAQKNITHLLKSSHINDDLHTTASCTSSKKIKINEKTLHSANSTSTTADTALTATMLSSNVTAPKILNAQNPLQSMVSSATLEQLREFESVLEQVTNTSQLKERNLCQPQVQIKNETQVSLPQQLLLPQASSPSSSCSSSSSAVSASCNHDVILSTDPSSFSQTAFVVSSQSSAVPPPPSSFNMTYINQSSGVNTSTASILNSKITSKSVIVATSYCEPILSPVLNIVSCSSNNTSVTPSQSSEAYETFVKTTKPCKSKPPKSNSVVTAIKSPIPKPQQKPQEDEETAQRIFAILDEYAEQLRNSPDLKNKPAPRRRSNPPTNSSQSPKRKKSSMSKIKLVGTSSVCSELSPGTDDPQTAGSEDSSSGMMQLSHIHDSPLSVKSPSEFFNFKDSSIDNSKETGMFSSPDTTEIKEVQQHHTLIFTDGNTVHGKTLLLHDVSQQSTDSEVSDNVALVTSKPVIVSNTATVPLYVSNGVHQVFLPVSPNIPSLPNAPIVSNGSKTIRVHQINFPNVSSQNNSNTVPGTALLLRQMCLNKYTTSVAGTPVSVFSQASVKQVQLPVAEISSHTMYTQQPMISPETGQHANSVLTSAIARSLSFLEQNNENSQGHGIGHKNEVTSGNSRNAFLITSETFSSKTLPKEKPVSVDTSNFLMSDYSAPQTIPTSPDDTYLSDSFHDLELNETDIENSNSTDINFEITNNPLSDCLLLKNNCEDQPVQTSSQVVYTRADCSSNLKSNTKIKYSSKLDILSKKRENTDNSLSSRKKRHCALLEDSHMLEQYIPEVQIPYEINEKITSDAQILSVKVCVKKPYEQEPLFCVSPKESQEDTFIVPKLKFPSIGVTESDKVARGGQILTDQANSTYLEEMMPVAVKQEITETSNSSLNDHVKNVFQASLGIPRPQELLLHEATLDLAETSSYQEFINNQIFGTDNEVLKNKENPWRFIPLDKRKETMARNNIRMALYYPQTSCSVNSCSDSEVSYRDDLLMMLSPPPSVRTISFAPIKPVFRGKNNEKIEVIEQSHKKSIDGILDCKLSEPKKEKHENSAERINVSKSSCSQLPINTIKHNTLSSLDSLNNSDGFKYIPNPTAVHCYQSKASAARKANLIKENNTKNNKHPCDEYSNLEGHKSGKNISLVKGKCESVYSYGHSSISKNKGPVNVKNILSHDKNDNSLASVTLSVNPKCAFNISKGMNGVYSITPNTRNVVCKQESALKTCTTVKSYVTAHTVTKKKESSLKQRLIADWDDQKPVEITPVKYVACRDRLLQIIPPYITKPNAADTTSNSSSGVPVPSYEIAIPSPVPEATKLSCPNNHGNPMDKKEPTLLSTKMNVPVLTAAQKFTYTYAKRECSGSPVVNRVIKKTRLNMPYQYDPDPTYSKGLGKSNSQDSFRKTKNVLESSDSHSLSTNTGKDFFSSKSFSVVSSAQGNNFIGKCNKTNSTYSLNADTQFSSHKRWSKRNVTEGVSPNNVTFIQTNRQFFKDSNAEHNESIRNQIFSPESKRFKSSESKVLEFVHSDDMSNLNKNITCVKRSYSRNPSMKINSCLNLPVSISTGKPVKDTVTITELHHAKVNACSTDALCEVQSGSCHCSRKSSFRGHLKQCPDCTECTTDVSDQEQTLVKTEKVMKETYKQSPKIVVSKKR